MSEYQYYEFRALDRALSRGDMDKLRAVSSRGRITSSSFVNEYEWGNFKGDPVKWMERYFDAFLYMANWGSRWFMVRVPAAVCDLEVVSQYVGGENVSYHEAGKDLVFSFEAEVDDHEWTDGDGWLDSLVSLRSNLMRGDFRPLYLGWLLGVQEGEYYDEDTEPPVPPGLSALDDSYESFVAFLGLDSNLIAAAAEGSAPLKDVNLSRKEIEAWVDQLSVAEKDEAIAGIISGETPAIGACLRMRALRAIHERHDSQALPERRTASQILNRAQELAKIKLQRQAKARAVAQAKREREEAQKRAAHLEFVAANEDTLRSKVDKLIAMRAPARYDEAVSILLDLRDAAEGLGRLEAFNNEMANLARIHKSKPSLQDRFRRSKLL